jgi:hypothetical protein
MTLEQKASSEIAAAMKAKDGTRLGTFRLLKTALTNKSVEKGRPLEPAEELQVVSSQVKQRREAIEQFTAGNRPDLAAREQAEIAVLETLLPPAATPEDVAQAVEAAVTETGAAGAKDIGRVMKAAQAALKGKTVDGRRLNEAVRARLAP